MYLLSQGICSYVATFQRETVRCLLYEVHVLTAAFQKKAFRCLLYEVHILTMRLSKGKLLDVCYIRYMFSRCGFPKESF